MSDVPYPTPVFVRLTEVTPPLKIGLILHSKVSVPTEEMPIMPFIVTEISG